jgi:uncharacterized membrane protein
MNSTAVYALALAIGVIAGLRSMTAPAVVSWAAHLGWINLQNTRLSFLGHAVTAYILTVLAIGELVTDKLPKTPSRKAPGPFAARIVLGGLCGAALAIAGQQSWIAGAVCGSVGGVVGTLGGHAVRTGLVRTLKCPDYLIALLEDAVAVAGGVFIVTRF